FYNTEIANQDQKVVVIISDALRFEVGENLLSELHVDTKNTAEMRYMLASIPSKTNIGMSQLLPHKKLSYDGKTIRIDDIENAGIDNRTKILQLRNPHSRAIQYAEIEGKNIVELREIFKD